MSDLELVIELTKRLGLVENLHYSNKPGCIWLDGKEYAKYKDDDKQVIEFGSGSGYDGFAVSFVFDSNGKLIEHKVWE